MARRPADTAQLLVEAASAALAGALLSTRDAGVAIVDAAVGLLGGDAGALLVARGDPATSYRIAALRAAGWTDADDEPAIPLLGAGRAWTAESGEPVFVETLESADPVLAAVVARVPGAASGLIVPLARPLDGCLIVLWTRAARPSVDDLAAVGRLAGLGVLALQVAARLEAAPAPTPDPALAATRRGLHEVNNLLGALIVRAEMLAEDLSGEPAALAQTIVTIAREVAEIARRVEVATATARQGAAEQP